ncbi:MAG: hypothetical protein A2Y97_11615 [Nitrospirae bacterium RBG_13_39_12]|nr:MAG: hypothetical protein A2Y97_11615 [Nitrospirae bacterium RBG_13_39_12]
MPKPIKKRIPKKPTSVEVNVKDKLTSLKDIIDEHQKTVLKYGAVIIVTFIAIISFIIYSHTSDKKAKILDYEAYKIYYNEYQKPSLNKEEQYKKALDLFKKAYDKKKKPISLFYIAACYYELGKYDDAMTTLKDFTQRYSSEDNLIPLAYQKITMVYVKKGDIPGAMKTLDNLYNLKVEFYKDFALMEYGRLLEKEGKKDKAMNKYKELTTKFPNSPFFDEANTKLLEKKTS